MAFARERKIERLLEEAHALELKVKEVQQVAAKQKIFDKQRLDSKDSCIKAQRVLLEKHEEAGGYTRQGAQFWAALTEQNYDRASKIAHGSGPYTTPVKEKAPKDSKACGQVMALELAYADEAADGAEPNYKF